MQKYKDGILIEMSEEEIREHLASLPPAHIPTYQELRLAEYPNIGDQLDALWKLIESFPVESLPDDSRKMLRQIQNIKLKFPKE